MWVERNRRIVGLDCREKKNRTQYSHITASLSRRTWVIQLDSRGLSEIVRTPFLVVLVTMVSVLVIWLAYCLYINLEVPSSDPLRTAEKSRTYNPDQTVLAALDFSLRLQAIASQTRESSVFSPINVAEGLHITHDNSRARTRAEVERILVDKSRFESVNTEYWYRGYSRLLSSVPGVGIMRSDAGTFGVKRNISVLSEQKVNVNDWVRSYMGIDKYKRQIMEGEGSESAVFSYRNDMKWVGSNLLEQKEIGGTTLRIADTEEAVIDLRTKLYCDFRWVRGGAQPSAISQGLAPFYIDGEVKTVPTICFNGWKNVYINRDRDAIAVRIWVHPAGEQEFWLVGRDKRSDGMRSKSRFSVEDLKHWLYVDSRHPSIEQPLSETTSWQKAWHLHFPQLKISSHIDVRDACRNMGSTLPFESTHVAPLEFSGEGAYIAQFHTDITLAVDEHGIGPASAKEGVTQPLPCVDPDVVFDQPFDFFLLNDYTFLLLGSVEDPTAQG